MDPLSYRIVSEKKLKGGIHSCLKSFTFGEKRIVIVGTGGGLYCFGEDGDEVSFTVKPPDASLTEEPLTDGNGVLFLGDDGLLYRLDENCKLNRIGQRSPLPGAPTSAPALLRRPHRLAVYGVVIIGNDITGEPRYRIVLAPLNSNRYQVQDVRTDATNKATPTEPTEWAASGCETERVLSISAYQGQESDLGLCLTMRGKVFKVDHNGLMKDPLIDLKCSPISQLILMNDGRIALIGNDLLSERPLRYLFSITGKLLSRAPLQDLGGNTVEKIKLDTKLELLKTTAVFTDNGRLNALIGFSSNSDSFLRLVDVQTGLVLATLRLPHVIDTLSHIQGTDFFVSGITCTYPDEASKHSVVRIVDNN